MSVPSYLIAKYIPDMRRMEPRNIGIILWSEGAIAARFMGESFGGQLVDHVPSFIGAKSKKVYVQWINHWRRHLRKTSIVLRSGQKVERASDNFLAAFRTKSRDNYVLVNGGVLLDQVRPEDMQDTIDYLFDKLVREEGHDEKDQAFRVLRKGWRRVVTGTGLRRRSDFKEKYPLFCRIEGVSRELKFDNAIGNGHPDALFQRTLLNRDESVYSTFLMLRAVTEQGILTKEKCAAVVHASASELQLPTVQSAVEMLRHHATIVNVGNEEDAITTIDSMGLPPAGDQ